jgi:hypothetical protein
MLLRMALPLRVRTIVPTTCRARLHATDGGMRGTVWSVGRDAEALWSMADHQ